MKFMGLRKWFLHTRWERKFDKILNNAREHSLAHLRRTHDFNRAIILSLTIAFFLNLLDILRDLILKNPSWKIGLFFEYIIFFAIMIFMFKNTNSESALEVREKRKQNSRKEAFKIMEEYHRIR